MKIATVVTILSASLVSVLALSATALLSNLGEPTADLRYEDIHAGWLLTMFCGPTLWSSLPSFPQDLTSVFDSFAVAYLCVCLVFVAAAARRYPTLSRTGAALLTLGLGIVPSIVGAVVLQDGSASPSEAGAWASFMIMGLLYAAIVSVVLAISDFAKPAWYSCFRMNQTARMAA